MVVTIEPLRRTPAGVPRQRLWLEHRSRQQDAGQAREVQARMAVILTGDEAVRHAADLKEGQRIRIQGFLARAGFRGEARERLEVHARQLDRLE